MMELLKKGKTFKPLFLCLAVILLFTSCSFFENSRHGTLHLRLKKETVSKIKESRSLETLARSETTDTAAGQLEENLYIMVYIYGDYTTQLDSPVLITGRDMDFSFDAVPAEATVYAEAEIYQKVTGTDENGEETEDKKVFYEGKSDLITVKNGKNELNLKLKRIVPYIDPRVEYTVKHLFQPLEGEEYVENEDERETLLGMPGETSAAAAKDVEGFTARSFEQLVIEEDGSTVISIYYDRNKVTLVFDYAYGGTTAELTGFYGAPLFVDDPVRNNFDFAGWSPELPETFPAASPDKPYTALWAGIEVPYTVKHIMQTIDGSYEVAETENKTGYAGLETEAVAKQDEGFTVLPFSQNELAEGVETVIEIIYDRNVVTLTFELAGGSAGIALSDENKLTGFYGAPLSIADPVKANFDFAGWSPELPEAFPATSPEKPYTALWTGKPASYTVKHMQQDVSGDGYTEVTEDTEVITGISGETTEASAKEYAGFTALTFAQQNIAEDGSTEITVKYDRNVYRVVFDSMEGSSVEDQSVRYRAKAVEPDVPVKAGSAFLGWYTSADGGTTLSDEAFSFETEITGNITLYAKWSSGSVIITVSEPEHSSVQITDNSTPGAETLVFVIANYNSANTYHWYLDGNEITGTSDVQIIENKLIIQKNSFVNGTYVITLVSGAYSSSVTVEITSN